MNSGIAHVATTALINCRVLVFALGLLIVGCVPIPISTQPRFSEATLIKAKQAKTRDEILTLLGQPDARRAEREFYYGWANSYYAVAWAIPYGGAGIFHGSSGFSLLTVEFDQNGTIVRSELNPGSDAYLDYVAGAAQIRLPMILASESEDAEAKLFHPPPDRCAIYVYGSGMLPLMSLTFDNHGVVKVLASLWHAYYVVIYAKAGPHQITTTNPGPRDLGKNQSATLDIECTPGAVLFARVWIDSGWDGDGSVIERVDDREGREAVRQHRRILTQYSDYAF